MNIHTAKNPCETKGYENYFITILTTVISLYKRLFTKNIPKIKKVKKIAKKSCKIEKKIEIVFQYLHYDILQGNYLNVEIHKITKVGLIMIEK